MNGYCYVYVLFRLRRKSALLVRLLLLFAYFLFGVFFPRAAERPSLREPRLHNSRINIPSNSPSAFTVRQLWHRKTRNILDVIAHFTIDKEFRSKPAIRESLPLLFGSPADLRASLFDSIRQPKAEETKRETVVRNMRNSCHKIIFHVYIIIPGTREEPSGKQSQYSLGRTLSRDAEPARCSGCRHIIRV